MLFRSAVDGPMINQLNLDEHAPKEKFSAKTELVYDKAIASAKAVFDKAKIADLI